MSTTAAQQRANVEEWAAEQFAPIDLSGFPSLQEKPAPDAHDDRWSRDYRDTALSASAHALRSFVSDPDVEALERVGQETGRPEFRAEVRQRRGEATAEKFKRENPSYIPTPENYATIVETLAFNALPSADQEGEIDEVVARLTEQGFWTVPNLTACFHALTREGLLQIPDGQARNLSDGERLQVMRLAQNGYVERAIDKYLQYALDDDTPSIEVLNDPSYRGALDTAVMFVFETATLDYSPDEERRAYLLRFAAGRPLTYNLLSQGWQSLKQRDARYARQETLDQFQRPQETAPTERELNDLSDDAVENLYHASLRKYADSFRRAPGVLA